MDRTVQFLTDARFVFSDIAHYVAPTIFAHKSTSNSHLLSFNHPISTAI